MLRFPLSRTFRGAGFGLVIALLAIVAVASPAQAAERLRVAIGDVAGPDWLIVLLSLEQARQRGLDSEVIWVKQEENATQAVLDGQAEIGLGTPYAVIQKLPETLRILFQAYQIQFFPVADKRAHPDWPSLDGREIAVHSRTSATLALARSMEKAHGIAFSEILFLPGSQVRATALLKGTIGAAYLDTTNRDVVLRERPGEFHVLPSGEASASDETLFARADWIAANRASVDILVEAFLKVSRRVAADPFYALEERQRLGLLSELPAEIDAEVAAYMIAAAGDGIFPPNLGGRAAAEADLRFFAEGGQLEGDPASLRVEDFWSLEPLERALAKLGRARIAYEKP